jgi:superfamily I DNA and/or RNA helicase
MLPIHRPAFANLIRNYRSHPAILAIPSSLFYHDTLEPEATDTNRLADWSEWQGRLWPVLFRNNASEDDQEEDGGGWYNRGEARIACEYAASLVESGLVEQKEVCIMSPFKAQVSIIDGYFLLQTLFNVSLHMKHLSQAITDVNSLI